MRNKLSLISLSTLQGLIGLIFILFTSTIYTAESQTLPPKLEKRFSRDLNSLFESLKNYNSTGRSQSDISLALFANTIMKNVKGFKLINNGTKDLSYSSTVKKRNKSATTYLSFSRNQLDSSQVYISHSIVHFPYSIDTFYSAFFKEKFGKAYGELCGGNKIYTKATLPWYISLNQNSLAMNHPYLTIFPINFSTENNWTEWEDRRKIAFKERIIIDTLYRLQDFTTLTDQLNNSKFVERTSTTNFSSFELSFFRLIEKEYEEYMRTNIERLQRNPNVAQLYAAVDSLEKIKKKELNIEWFSLSLKKTNSLQNNTIKEITCSIFLRAKPSDEKEELKELSEKLAFCLNQANMNELFLLLSGVLKQLSSGPSELKEHEMISGNYRINARKIEPLSRAHWQFAIQLRACE